MKLFYAETINPRKACAVARYLNVPIDYVHVDLGKGENRTPEYLAVNPNGKVPAFEDGDLKLWEANAIMCYLARAAGSDLWPGDARQIEVIRWLCWNSEHFTRHAGSLYFQNIVKPALGFGEPDEAAVKEAALMYALCNPTLSPLDGLLLASPRCSLRLIICGCYTVRCTPGNVNSVTIPIINEIHSTIQHLNNIDIVKHET